jgi:hypothetical protein
MLDGNKFRKFSISATVCNGNQHCINMGMNPLNSGFMDLNI